MSTTIAVRFPWGRYHATPWGRHVNEAAIEFPPSPWRLLRALFSTWKGRAPELDEATVHKLLEQLLAPPSYRVPEYIEAHTRHYMPDITDGTDKVIDAFAVFERDAELLVTWPVDIDEAQRSALAVLVERLPYIGRAESICDARIVPTSNAPVTGTLIEPLTDDVVADEVLRLLVLDHPLDFSALVARTTDVRDERRLVPPGATWQRYTAPQVATPRPEPRHPKRPRPTAIRWSFDSNARPSIHATVAITDVLRRACMSGFGRRNAGGASENLSGKRDDGRPLEGHRHAHYLALDTDGDRLIDTLLLWMPSGISEEDLDPLADLHRLTGFQHVADFRPGRLGLEAVGSIEAIAPELVGPSIEWESYTPFAPARFPRRKHPWEAHVIAEVGQELRWRGLPEPGTVDLLRGDWLDYRRHRPTKERLGSARRACGARLRFKVPIDGPIVLGALSHFGLGMFLPISDP
jgi:CRISPR-associated protein Csb2